MNRFLRFAFLGLIALFALLLIGPFLVPVPPLEGTRPVEELADPDSQFVDVDGIQVHYKAVGEGEPALLLLHGFGASLFTWREVLQPLSTYGRVVAFDRPAFGLTERPLDWEGKSPYSPEAQVDQAIGLLDRLGIDQAILVGNSAGGTIAIQAALEYPDRIPALILVDPAVYVGGTPAWVRLVINTPQADRLGPLFVRNIRNWGERLLEQSWQDPSQITSEIRAGYTKPLLVENWDRALWEFTRASRPSGFLDRLDELQLPVLVITGDADRVVPTEQSIRFAGELPSAKLVVIPDCGHLPQEECSEAFLQAVSEFLSSLSTASAQETKALRPGNSTRTR